MVQQQQVQQLQQMQGEIGQMRAQMASSNASAASPPSVTDPSRIIDTRVIGKPDMFYGEKEKWKDWSFQLRIYMMAVNQVYSEMFGRIDDADVPMQNRALSPRSRSLSMQLYYVLAMLCRAKAQDKINTVTEGE